jgi:hypothetical protein
MPLSKPHLQAANSSCFADSGVMAGRRTEMPQISLSASIFRQITSALLRLGQIQDDTETIQTICYARNGQSRNRSRSRVQRGACFIEPAGKVQSWIR